MGAYNINGLTDLPAADLTALNRSWNSPPADRGPSRRPKHGLRPTDPEVGAVVFRAERLRREPYAEGTQTMVIWVRQRSDQPLKYEVY